MNDQNPKEPKDDNPKSFFQFERNHRAARVTDYFKQQENGAPSRERNQPADNVLPEQNRINIPTRRNSLPRNN